MRYHDGEEVHLGDIVDVARGQGPKMRVVVIVATNEAVDGFDAKEWAHLGPGVLLKDADVFGLLWLARLDEEQILMSRA